MGSMKSAAAMRLLRSGERSMCAEITVPKECAARTKRLISWDARISVMALQIAARCKIGSVMRMLMGRSSIARTPVSSSALMVESSRKNAT